MKKIKLPSIKKNIEAFLNSEEGKISKKNVLCLGVGVVAVSLLAASPILAEHSSYSQNVSGRGQHVSSTVHSSHSSHANHSNHSNCHTSCSHSSCHSSCHSSHSQCHQNCHGDYTFPMQCHDNFDVQ
jgi:hypothetical protein